MYAPLRQTHAERRIIRGVLGSPGGLHQIRTQFRGRTSDEEQCSQVASEGDWGPRIPVRHCWLSGLGSQHVSIIHDKYEESSDERDRGVQVDR